MAKLKSAIVAHKAQMNQQIGGAVDILGAFDNLIQPMFPFPMMNLSIVLTFEGIEKPTVFEVRLNGPDDDLITKGEFMPMVDPFGVGKKIVDIEKFLIKKRGHYTLDIFEKMGEDVKFIQTETLFIADYPPQRPLTDEMVEEILKGEEVIKSVKTEFQPFGAQKPIKLQYNLDKNDILEEGYIAIPESDVIEIDGETYELVGVRRQIEWMFGNPIPKEENQEENK
ncbi:hypothetical protein SAMN02745174_00654 [Cetobacterium ceti]|uniref:Uncharacterized protein n=1 Tax=Cetobacterium ceti TaxID=180163 RepID=A0A1T4KY62_9FUSO|nr:hypothetical protein [Cetobacterium ceti]SJZ47303.1 hypothetical protein SAMN02745174_00654 [Cetobacterium ceti]